MSADQLEFVGKLIRVLYPPSNNPSFKFFINFAFPSTSREVNYSAMGCTSIDDIVHSGHRNIKISGDGLVALRLSMFFSLKSTDNSLFPLLSFLHAQCDAEHKG